MSRRHRRHRRNEDIVSMWSDIGRTWMKVGLNMGRVALETSVDTLRTTAEMLDRMSKVADPGRERNRDRKAEDWPQNVEEPEPESDLRGKATTPGSAEPQADDRLEGTAAGDSPHGIVGQK